MQHALTLNHWGTPFESILNRARLKKKKKAQRVIHLSAGNEWQSKILQAFRPDSAVRIVVLTYAILIERTQVWFVCLFVCFVGIFLIFSLVLSAFKKQGHYKALCEF